MCTIDEIKSRNIQKGINLPPLFAEGVNVAAEHVHISILAGHSAAGFRAPQTSFRTPLAMVGVSRMLVALIAASFTDRRAELANLCGKPAVAGHSLSGKRANIRAFAIQADAIAHHLDVFLVQASVVTMVAFLHTT